MLGRGAVADPFLARRIRAGQLTEPDADQRAAEWQALLPLLSEFGDRVRLKVEPRHAPGRIKQWLHLLARNYAGARSLFAEIRGLRTLAEVDAVLARHRVEAGDVAMAPPEVAASVPSAQPALRVPLGCAA